MVAQLIPTQIPDVTGVGGINADLDIDAPATPGSAMATTAAATPTGIGQGAPAPTAATTSTQEQSPSAQADMSRYLADFMGSDSPVMQQARTQGLQAANQRGLLNSTMAVGAAENEAYRVAVPVASQMASQGFQREMMLSEQDFNRRTQEIDLNFRDHLAKMNIDAYDREKAASMAAATNNMYAQMFSSIAQNADLPSGVRDSYLRTIGEMRDSSMNLTEQFWGIDLEWETPSGEGGGPSAGEGGSGSGSGGSSATSGGSGGGQSNWTAGSGGAGGLGQWNPY